MQNNPRCDILLVVAIAMFARSADAQQPKQPTTREYLADAPAIPMLTKQEAVYVNQVIYAMVLDDLGLPKNMPRDRGLIQRTFNALGPESLPFLVEWMDYCANKYGTCPCTILGKKIDHYVRPSASKGPDLDTIEFIDKNLGKGLVVKDLPAAYKDLRVGIANTLKAMRKDKGLTLNAMKFDEVLKLATGIEDSPKARKLAEWRLTIGFIGAKKTDERAFDFLVGILEKADTPTQRKTVHEALTNWSGVENVATYYESTGAGKIAAEDWKAWRRGKK